jgi:hypothetical protein
MAISVDPSKFNSSDKLGTKFQAVSASDSNPVLIDGKYPRALYVGTGGVLTLFNGLGEKVDLGTVPDGFVWDRCSFTGVAATTVGDANTTATGLVAIP